MSHFIVTKTHTDFFVKLYKSHINTFNGCYEYPGTKNNIEQFIESFDNLITSIKNNNFDKKLIHRAVLGKASRGASKEQLLRFGEAFDKHIVKVYASQLGVYSNQLFIIDKAYKKGKKDTIVSSHIEHETAPPLRIDWRLRDRGEGTKIIDIAIEGVSLLATKRADFGASIKKGGLHALIIDLETKNAQN